MNQRPSNPIEAEFLRAIDAQRTRPPFSIRAALARFLSLITKGNRS